METRQPAFYDDFDDAPSVAERLAAFSRQSRARPFKMTLLGLLAAAVVFSLARPLLTSTGADNMAALQAQAFLHRHLALTAPVQDVAVFHGTYYDPFPPFPAVLLMPFVLVFGVAATNPVLISLLAAGVSIRLYILILKKLGVAADAVSWLTAAFFLGSAYWFCLRNSNGVWCFDHIVSVLCLLLAIYEALGKGRGCLSASGWAWRFCHVRRWHTRFCFLVPQCCSTLSIRYERSKSSTPPD